jgi:hypothetical protein
MKEKFFHSSHARPLDASTALQYMSGQHIEATTVSEGGSVDDYPSSTATDDSNGQGRSMISQTRSALAGWHSQPRSSSARLSHHQPRRGKASPVLLRKRHSAFIEEIANPPMPLSPPGMSSSNWKQKSLERRKTKRKTFFGKLR